ncbi:MAG: RNA-binding transcriptional accessory protein [Peptostreptococcaceae bacterium]|nr:RNA-binding transcriptional accessory protein [Peptostreptococcaceae bacterium]
MEQIIKQLAKELKIKVSQVRSTVNLIDEGNTIPFIARYRKEATGNLDDVVLRDLDDRLTYLRSLYKKKEEVLRLIDEQGKLTDELKAKIEAAQILNEVDDLYRPYRQKRKTRATIAMAKGLEPLADLIIAQEMIEGDLGKEAEKYIDSEKDVKTAEEALKGAMDIIAEKISDDADNRKQIRILTFDKGILSTEAVDKDQKSVYELYYDYSEPLVKMPPHRILAINRAEKEEFIKVKLVAPIDEVVQGLKDRTISNNESISKPLIESAVEDSYKRLIAPSIEREIRNALTEAAEEQAIKVFGENLKNLLLVAPIKDMVVMGFDPAYRTGCKIAVTDGTGKLLDYTTVYPTKPQNKVEEAKKILKGMIEKHGINIIAIGNGTGSRESEIIVSEMISEMDRKVYYTIVNEAGASVYSASKVANEEYPDINVSIRGAISIGRRLQDPLAELVKIDPKSVGVGQYQHDVNQTRLRGVLDGVVEDSVNKVGVDLNTASSSLLQHIAGLSKSVAGNIVKAREENGRFMERSELLKVKRLGPSAYEQAAGFLRIADGENALDNTSVHPESYEDTLRFIEIMGYSIDDVKNKRLHDINDKILAYEIPKEKEALKMPEKGTTLTSFDALKSFKFEKPKQMTSKDRNNLIDKHLKKIAEDLGMGFPTLKDIVEELKKPGRDPRDEMVKPLFRSDVVKIEDLKEDMVFPGTVRNVTDFGAFVDIGLKNDGLVHISELSDRFIKKAMDVVSVGDEVQVRVISVDLDRKRVSLSMKGFKK